ncbi:hypothetical protein ACFL2T_02725 [Elusimicrobiota bacterium]
MSITKIPMNMMLMLAIAPSLGAASPQGRHDPAIRPAHDTRRNAPVNIRECPDIISPFDRDLLERQGYLFTGGFIRLSAEPPLTPTQLKGVLSDLRSRRRHGVLSELRKLRRETFESGSATLSRLQAERLAATLERDWPLIPAEDRESMNAWLLESGYSCVRSVDLGRIIRAGELWQKKPLLWTDPAVHVPFWGRPRPRSTGVHDRARGWDLRVIRTSEVHSGAEGKPSEAKDPADVSPPGPRPTPEGAAGQSSIGRFKETFRAGVRPAFVTIENAKIRFLDACIGMGGVGRVAHSPAGGSLLPAGERSRGRLVRQVASLHISQDLVNELLGQLLQTSMIRDLYIGFDPGKNQIVARGLLKIPTASLKTLDIDKGVGDFKFQTVIKMRASSKGYLILYFPREKTYIYPAEHSRAGGVDDRVVIPVQFLSLALASVRGRLAILSGDYSVFDRQTARARRDMAKIDEELAAKRIAPLEREALQDDRRRLELRLETIELDRRKAGRSAKKLDKLVAFIGEKEIDANKALLARRNGLLLRIRLEDIVPYLKDIKLGGIRVIKGSSNENYLAIDVDGYLKR